MFDFLSLWKVQFNLLFDLQYLSCDNEFELH